MRKIALSILFIPFCSFAYLSNTSIPPGFTPSAVNADDFYEFIKRNCDTLECTQHMIKMFDNEISVMVVKRAAYVRLQGELKGGDVLAPKTTDSVNAQAKDVSNRAKAQGYSPGSANKIFNAIHQDSNEQEQRAIEESK